MISVHSIVLAPLSEKSNWAKQKDCFWVPGSVLHVCVAFLTPALCRISRCSFVMGFEMGKVHQHFPLSGLHWWFALLVFYVHPGVGLSHSVLWKAPGFLFCFVGVSLELYVNLSIYQFEEYFSFFLFLSLILLHNTALPRPLLPVPHSPLEE